MGFQKFISNGKNTSQSVSIAPNGVMSFSDSVRRKWDLDKNSFCVFFYDEDGQRIGVEFTEDEHTEGAHKIRLRETGADVSAKRFLHFNELGITRTMVYRPIREGELMVLLLFAGVPRGNKKIDDVEAERGGSD